MSRGAGPARAWILLAAGLSLLAARAATAQQAAVVADPQAAGQPEDRANAAHAALVFRYAAGEQAAAASEARRLTAQDLRRRLDWLLGLRENAESERRDAAWQQPARELMTGLPWCPACSSRGAWERFPLLSAVLLHGEAAWSPSATPDGGQLAMAIDLARLLAARAGGKERAARFCLAIGYRMLDEGKIEEAQSWTAEGRKHLPNDPLLLLAAGTIEETLAAVGYAEGYRRGRAARLFRAALDVQPDLHEARLRLGRVEWQRRHRDQAERLYRQVLAAESGAQMRYLAQLFLGRLQEDQGLLEDAASSYRAALALDPEAQTALLALSHALHRLGAEQESRDLVERSLALAGSRERADVFGTYAWGRSASYDEVWESLRVAARKEAQP
jgi:tetratricopeptide (TPR) repeat protein